MRLFLFTLCFAFISSFLSAQINHQVLISLELNKVSDLNQIEKLQLPVIHLFDDLLITRADNNVIKKLREQNIEFRIIDENISGMEYYLATPKKKNAQMKKPETVNIVFERFEEFIIKNPGSIEKLISNGYNIAKLSDSPVLFKNEKTILNNAHINVDTTISNIVANINADSAAYFIQSLQDFQTRFLFANTRDSVASWIKSQFLRFGFTDVKLDSFQYQGTWQKNVVATLTGTVLPENYYVFGGHHDSYSSGDPYTFAPGADDNASGTAAILEVARVIMQSGYQPRSTIKFITFAAEEYGLWGSKHYAQYALDQGINIRLMINHDMISHTSRPLSVSNVDINYYTGSDGWSNLAYEMVNNYSVLTPYYGSSNSSGSDSYSFWQRGYKAVYFEERDFSPFYHSPQDIITNYSMPYCAEVIKSSGALLLTAVKMPAEIKNYYLYDTGNGTSLSLFWSPNTEPGFAHYNIYVGISSGIYDYSFTTTDTTFIINNLTEGVKYYVAVSSVNTEGSESFLTERNMIPNSIPLVPDGLTVNPAPLEINLRWNRNMELDLAGYNIYRAESINGSFLKLNGNAYIDTFYTDNSVSAGKYYYYFIKAVDYLLNESPGSDTLRSQLISLDRGILLVDETNDGDGSILNPTDLQVDEFYQQLLGSFIVTDYDIISEGEITLADLGAFSTVIWQADDNISFNSAYNAKSAIKEYLDYGGNFIYTGYRPSKALHNNTSAAAKYSEGMFIYDYLKIDSSLNIINSRFIGAIPYSNDYFPVFVDSSKSSANDGYHLRGIETVFPNGEGTAIYKFETYFDTTINQGKLKGKPVGVEYIGSNHKSVVLGFPLYYMNLNQAKAFMENILVNKFNEITNIKEDNNISVPNKFELTQNYPNPFNPVTSIKYQVSSISQVVLKVYDLLGKEVAVLVNEEKPAGRYEVMFDASSLSSGVYFYQIQAGEFVQTKKMILIR